MTVTVARRPRGQGPEHNHTRSTATSSQEKEKEKEKRSTATPRAYPSASQLRQTTRYLSTRPNRDVTRRGAWRRHHRRPPPPARGPTPPAPPFPPPARAITSGFAARIALGLSPSLSSKGKRAPSPDAHAHRAPSAALKAQAR